MSLFTVTSRQFGYPLHVADEGLARLGQVPPFSDLRSEALVYDSAVDSVETKVKYWNALARTYGYPTDFKAEWLSETYSEPAFIVTN